MTIVAPSSDFGFLNILIASSSAGDNITSTWIFTIPLSKPGLLTIGLFANAGDEIGDDVQDNRRILQ